MLQDDERRGRRPGSGHDLEDSSGQVLYCHRLVRETGQAPEIAEHLLARVDAGEIPHAHQDAALLGGGNDRADVLEPDRIAGRAAQGDFAHDRPRGHRLALSCLRLRGGPVLEVADVGVADHLVALSAVQGGGSVVGVDDVPIEVHQHQRFGGATEEVTVGEQSHVAVCACRLRVGPEDGRNARALVRRGETPGLNVSPNPDVTTARQPKIGQTMPAAWLQRRSSHLVTLDVTAADDGQQLGPGAANGLGGGHAEDPFRMRVPAEDDARTVHDHDARFQLFEQLEIIDRHTSSHATPPGVRRTSDLLSGPLSPGPIVASRQVLSAAL